MQALKQQRPLCGSEQRDALVCCDPLIRPYNSRHYLRLLVCCPSDAAAWQRGRKGVGSAETVFPALRGHFQNKHRRYFNPERLAGDEI